MKNTSPKCYLKNNLGNKTNVRNYCNNIIPVSIYIFIHDFKRKQ